MTKSAIEGVRIKLEDMRSLLGTFYQDVERLEAGEKAIARKGEILHQKESGLIKREADLAGRLSLIQVEKDNVEKNREQLQEDKDTWKLQSKKIQEQKQALMDQDVSVRDRLVQVVVAEKEREDFDNDRKQLDEDMKRVVEREVLIDKEKKIARERKVLLDKREKILKAKQVKVQKFLDME